MFAQKFLANFRKERRPRAKRVDMIAEQVKNLLKTSDQQIILMARG